MTADTRVRMKRADTIIKATWHGLSEKHTGGKRNKTFWRNATAQEEQNNIKRREDIRVSVRV